MTNEVRCWWSRDLSGHAAGRGVWPIQGWWPVKIAYVLGLRHMSLAAAVTVLDGTVSSIQYSIEPDVFLGWPVSYLVEARSAHGFWRNRDLVPVSIVDD